ncbi:unnamed protein product [Caenorhabditis sp. 36 PRJEB53466]|nr:unnamed protein product [Caenorhabditis sp. 36 PRJEB53466]
MASMTSEEAYKTHRVLIYSIVLIFEVFGLFGNVNLVFVIARNKILQSKFGLILASLATFHTVCLLCELINLGYGVAATFYSFHIFRSVCFHSTFPVILAHCLQTGTICVLSFDLFLSILTPIKYRRFDISWYFPLLYFLPVCYGFGITLTAKILLDDKEIPMCNPPSSMVPSVSKWWYQLMFFFAFITIFFYSSAFGLLSWKVRHKSVDIHLIERRAMRTLQVLIVFFLLTRFISTGVATMVTFLKVNSEYASLVQNYNVIPAMAAYSQNAYVCFFRSKEYRRLLTEQMALYIPFVESSQSLKQVERSTTKHFLNNCDTSRNSARF